MKSLKYVVKRRLHQSNCKMANFSGIFHHWEDLGKCVGVHETFCGVTRGVRQKNFLSTCANRWREKRSENRKIASMPNLVRYTFIYSYGNDWFQSLLVSDFAFSLKLMKYDWRGNWRRCQPNIYDQGKFLEFFIKCFHQWSRMKTRFNRTRFKARLSFPSSSFDCCFELYFQNGMSRKILTFVEASEKFPPQIWEIFFPTLLIYESKKSIFSCAEIFMLADHWLKSLLFYH